MSQLREKVPLDEKKAGSRLRGQDKRVYQQPHTWYAVLKKSCHPAFPYEKGRRAKAVTIKHKKLKKQAGYSSTTQVKNVIGCKIVSKQKHFPTNTVVLG